MALTQVMLCTVLMVKKVIISIKDLYGNGKIREAIKLK
jgi:hypothetical protein